MSAFEQRHVTGLLVMRSWVALSISVLSWSLTMVVVGPRWAELSGFEKSCLMLAGLLIASAVVLARWRWTLWLLVIAMLALGSTALVPAGSAVWTYPATYFGYVGFMLTMLLPRSFGLVTAIATPFVIWGVWLTEPSNVVPEAFSIANGSVMFVRILGSQLLLWWAWHGLMARAGKRDDQWQALRDSELQAISVQERSALWREQAARVHATLLNSINALMETRRVDVDRLRMLAAQGRSALSTPPHLQKRDAPQATFTEPQNAGIVLLTSALAGMLIGGSLYVFFVPYSTPLWALATIITAITANVLAVIVVVRRRRIPWWAGSIIIALAASIPWMLLDWVQACDSIAAITAVASIAGFVIVCVGLWSGLVPFVLGLVVWAAGAVQIAQTTPDSCSLAPTVIVLNVATFLPLAAVFAVVGGRFNRHSREVMEAAAAAAHLEDARARSLEEIDEALVAVARESAAELDAIAEAGALTEDDLVHLACLSAKMRAGVQVDVGGIEGMTRAAYVVIWQLADAGIPVEVGVLSAHGDPRPIPDEVVDLLLRLAKAAPHGRMRIQSLCTEDWDFLSMNVPVEAVAEFGIGESRMIDDIEIAVSEMDDEADMAVVTVERSTAQEVGTL